MKVLLWTRPRDGIGGDLLQADKRAEGIYEIGTGINTSLNDIVKTINKVLGTNIEPKYIDKPDSYIQETPVKAVPCKVSLEEGIKRIIDSL